MRIFSWHLHFGRELTDKPYMKFDCKFKHLDHSDALVEYTKDCFSKLLKYELKPVEVHVTYRAKRHLKEVEIHFKGLNHDFHALTATTDFQASVHQAVQKLRHQMEREKSKIQHHKNPQVKKLKRAS